MSKNGSARRENVAVGISLLSLFVAGGAAALGGYAYYTERALSAPKERPMFTLVGHEQRDLPKGERQFKLKFDNTGRNPAKGLRVQIVGYVGEAGAEQCAVVGDETYIGRVDPGNSISVRVSVPRPVTSFVYVRISYEDQWKSESGRHEEKYWRKHVPARGLVLATVEAAAAARKCVADVDWSVRGWKRVEGAEVLGN